MTLLLLATKVWRHKLLTLPVLAVVLAGSFYAVAVKAPAYEAGATYILVDPPAPIPGQIDSDNPYLRFSSQTVLIDALATRLNSQQMRNSLARRGADPKYTAASTLDHGYSGYSAPILEITGAGATPLAAVRTVRLVGRALATELARMQGVHRVHSTDRIRADAVIAVQGATLKGAGRLRTLAAVFALGLILLFVVISSVDSIAALRGRAGRDGIGEQQLALAGRGK